MSSRRVTALIVAAGRGVRVGEGLPKQYRPVAGRPVLRRSVEAFAAHPAVSEVRVVIGADDRGLYDAAVAGLSLAEPVVGGASRQESVRRGLEAIAREGGCELVLIHDAARPLVPAGLIGDIVDALAGEDGAVPALPVADSLRRGDSHVEGEVDRTALHLVQTPQGFRFDAILAAHRAARQEATDDAAVLHANGGRVAFVRGDDVNFKITRAEDFGRAEAILASRMISRTGSGFDVHRFGPGDHVWLCGVQVPHDAGLVGHSDADVALHALTDALLGAAADGDIGRHFPPSDPQWKGASSDRFLVHARDVVAARGGIVDHVDVTIIAERPKVGPHRDAMRARIAELLGLKLSAVSVKATTTEGLGFTGRGEGVAAQAMATVRLPAEDC